MAEAASARPSRPALLATFLLGGLLVGIVLVVVARVVLLR